MGLCAACCGDDVRALTLSSVGHTRQALKEAVSVGLVSIGMRYGPVCCLLCGDDVRALTLSSVLATPDRPSKKLSV